MAWIVFWLLVFWIVGGICIPDIKKAYAEGKQAKAALLILLTVIICFTLLLIRLALRHFVLI